MQWVYGNILGVIHGNIPTSGVSVSRNINVNAYSPPQPNPMFVKKRDGKQQEMQFDKITARIKKMCYGLNPEYVDPVLPHIQHVTDSTSSHRICVFACTDGHCAKDRRRGVPRRHDTRARRARSPDRYVCVRQQHSSRRSHPFPFSQRRSRPHNTLTSPHWPRVSLYPICTSKHRRRSPTLWSRCARTCTPSRRCRHR